jgi:SAM-dependent methyltransferase
MNKYLPQEKFYSDRNTAGKYDRVRFRSRGGAIIDQVEKELVLKALGKRKGVKILDLGCGTGRLIYELSQRGYRNIYGLDISGPMLSIAKKRVPAAKFIKADVKSLPPSVSGIDACISLRVIHHFGYKETKRIFEQVNNAMKKGGVFVFDTLNMYSINSFAKAANLFRAFAYNNFSDETTIENILKEAGFRIEGRERRFFVPPLVLRFSNGFAPLLDSFNRKLEKTRLSYFCASTFWTARKA